MKKVIKFKDISLNIKDRNILKNIHFSCNSGEITGISGPAGSGKTMLLTLPIQREGKPTGSMEITGKDILSMKSKEKKNLVSVLNYYHGCPINTEASLFDFILSGRERFRKPLSPYSRNDRDMTENIIHDLRLEKLKGEKLRNISASMFQLALIARTINMETPGIFLCSPEEHLNPNEYSLIKLVLKQLIFRKKATIVMESNNLNFLFTFCDKIVFLKNGETQGEFIPEEIDENLIKNIFEVEVSISRNIITSKPEIQLLENI